MREEGVEEVDQVLEGVSVERDVWEEVSEGGDLLARGDFLREEEERSSDR